MVDDALLCRCVEAAPSGTSIRQMTADGSGGKRQGLSMTRSHLTMTQPPNAATLPRAEATPAIYNCRRR